MCRKKSRDNKAAKTTKSTLDITITAFTINAISASTSNLIWKATVPSVDRKRVVASARATAAHRDRPSSYAVYIVF